MRVSENLLKPGGGKRSWRAAKWKLTPIESWTNYDVNDPLRTTLIDAVEFLKDRGVDYALIGGLAASLRGQPRVTADVDMVIATDVDGALSLLNDVENSKFLPLFVDADEVVKKAFILPLRHRAAGVKLDMAIGLSGFEQQAIRRAELVIIGDYEVAVATAEDLIVMKLLAGRAHDKQDVQGILISRGGQLDWQYCEQVAKELGEAIGQDLLRQVKSLQQGSPSEPI
jgi:hypothetical protein